MDDVYAIESFIEYLDDSMIAEEGFKDAMKTAGGKVAAGAKFVGKKILQFIRALRDLARRIVARVKGLGKETKVNSDQYFCLTKINKVRLAAISKAIKDPANGSLELKKVNKVSETWNNQIANRKAKYVKINPGAINKICSENDKILNMLNAKVTEAEKGNNTKAMQVYQACAVQVQKTLKEAHHLCSFGAGHSLDAREVNSDVERKAQKKPDPRMHRNAKRINKALS